MSVKKDSSVFFQQCADVHNGFYSYEKAVYISSNDKITVTCPIHGDFEVRASHHISGIRCRNCCPGNMLGIFSIASAEIHKDEWENIKSRLYFLKISSGEEVFYKIGQTTLPDMKDRLKEFPKSYNVDIMLTCEGNLYENTFIETRLLKECQSFSYEPKLKFRGFKECLSENPLEYYYNEQLANYEAP